MEKDDDLNSENEQSLLNNSSNKKSLVHAYFIYDKTNDTSKCKTCPATVKGCNTTNLENHLKIKKHKSNEYLEYLEDKENAALSSNSKKIVGAKAKSLLQPTLPQFAIKKAKYTRKNTKQLLLRKKLAFVVATTSMPTSISDNKDWQAYVELLDPRHIIPGRKALAKDILRLFKQARKLVKAQVQNAVSKPNMTADIWTKPGMSSSYLGATIHYVNAKHEIEQVVLELLHFPSPHTGAIIGDLMKRVITEWGFEVPIIVTDNGSNMVKAFQVVSTQEDIEAVIDSVATGRTESNNEDNQEEESIFSNSDSDESDDSCALMSNIDVESFEDNFLEDQVIIVTPLLPDSESQTVAISEDPMDQTECDPNEALLEKLKIDEDVRQFLEHEKQMENAISQIMIAQKKSKRLRRISYLSHSLQLVMATFDKYRVEHLHNPSITPFFIKVIARAKKLVAKFNCSTKATPRLIELSKKKLVGDVLTRWSSTYLLLKRLLELRDSVTIVCEELDMDGLLNTEWAALKKNVNLLEPFASYTQLVSAGKTVTFSAIVPCIEELRLHLEKFSEENPSFAGVCDAMKNDLNHRFDFMIDETMDNFDCLYLLGTELDPNYRLFVSGEPAVQNIVTRHINKTAEDLGLETGHNEDNAKVQEEERETGTDGPRNLNAHEFKLLYAKTVSATPESHFRNPGSSKSKIQLELLDYIAIDLEAHVLRVEGIRQKIDSLAFWTSQRHRFPYLSKLAFTLLALQASSAPSEREFSIAGWHCAGRKNCTDKDNLAAKVFISCNKDILRPLLF